MQFFKDILFRAKKHNRKEHKRSRSERAIPIYNYGRAVQKAKQIGGSPLCKPKRNNVMEQEDKMLQTFFFLRTVELIQNFKAPPPPPPHRQQGSVAVHYIHASSSAIGLLHTIRTLVKNFCSDLQASW